MRAALASPVVVLGDPDANADAIIALAKRADADSSALLLLPELSVTGYAIEDLLMQEALLDSAEDAIARIAEETQSLLPVIVLGAPIRADQAIYNCAVVLHRGRILGVVPKTYLPNYREFYEKRYFRSGADAISDSVVLADQEVPFGLGLLFRRSRHAGLRCCMPKFAKTFGRPRRRLIWAQWRARPCWQISPPRTSRSAKRASAQFCAMRKAAAVSPPIFILPRVMANRRRIWPGTVS